jgi:hypothetical protein
VNDTLHAIAVLMLALLGAASAVERVVAAVAVFGTGIVLGALLIVVIDHYSRRHGR